VTKRRKGEEARLNHRKEEERSSMETSFGARE